MRAPSRESGAVSFFAARRGLTICISQTEMSVASQESTSNRFLGGRCQCGAVRYTVADEFVYAANCHCSNCRQATGSAFKPFAGIERDKLGITKGENNLMIFGDHDGND